MLRILHFNLTSPVALLRPSGLEFSNLSVASHFTFNSKRFFTLLEPNVLYERSHPTVTVFILQSHVYHGISVHKPLAYYSDYSWTARRSSNSQVKLKINAAIGDISPNKYLCLHHPRLGSCSFTCHLARSTRAIKMPCLVSSNRMESNVFWCLFGDSS